MRPASSRLPTDSTAVGRPSLEMMAQHVQSELCPNQEERESGTTPCAHWTAHGPGLRGADADLEGNHEGNKSSQRGHTRVDPIYAICNHLFNPQTVWNGRKSNVCVSVSFQGREGVFDDPADVGTHDDSHNSPWYVS